MLTAEVATQRDCPSQQRDIKHQNVVHSLGRGRFFRFWVWLKTKCCFIFTIFQRKIHCVCVWKAERGCKGMKPREVKCSQNFNVVKASLDPDGQEGNLLLFRSTLLISCHARIKSPGMATARPLLCPWACTETSHRSSSRDQVCSIVLRQFCSLESDSPLYQFFV